MEEMALAGRESRIPAERMKTNREHRVRCPGEALAALRKAQALADGSGVLFSFGAGRSA